MPARDRTVGAAANPKLWITHVGVTTRSCGYTLEPRGGFRKRFTPRVARMPFRVGTCGGGHPQDAHNRGMPFFTGVSGQVFYRRWEVEDPRAVLVFLHGLGQHTGHYHRFAKHLRSGGIELWALDHVGHGMTEGELGEVAALSELAENSRRLLRLARAERPGVPLALMGHSLGAATAMTALLEGPSDCAAVVLCGSPIGAARRRVTDDPDTAARRAEADAELRARFARGLERVGVPILALHGTDDRIIPVEGVREWIGSVAGVELIEYRDAGHDLLHEKVHHEVAEDVAHFLRARV